MRKLPFLFIVSLFLFLSCNQSSLSVNNLYSYLVLDFESENSKPTERLSVFVDTTEDARKIEYLEVTKVDSKMKWSARDLLLINYSEKMIAGYPNLVLPKGRTIEKGAYKVEIYNWDDSFVSTGFFLEKEDALLSMTGRECRRWMEDNHCRKNIIVFDKENKIIYYGEQTENMQTAKDIWLTYNNASSYSQILVLEKKSVICVMPQEQIQGEVGNE